MMHFLCPLWTANFTFTKTLSNFGRVWDLESDRLKSTLEGHASVVWSVAISPDGKTIVSGSDDKTVK